MARTRKPKVLFGEVEAYEHGKSCAKDDAAPCHLVPAKYFQKLADAWLRGYKEEWNRKAEKSEAKKKKGGAA